MKKPFFVIIPILILILTGCFQKKTETTGEGEQPTATEEQGAAAPGTQETPPPTETPSASEEQTLPPEDPIAGWQTYRNEEYGFEVKFPEDWKVMEGERTSDTYTPEGMDFSWKIGKYVSFCPKVQCQDTSAEIWMLTQTNIEEALAKNTELNASPDLQIDDERFLTYDAKVATFTHKVVGSEKYKNVVFEKDGTVFYLWGLTESSVPLDAIFNQILSTFKFIE